MSVCRLLGENLSRETEFGMSVIVRGHHLNTGGGAGVFFFK